jgi:hypothetical protein
MKHNKQKPWVSALFLVFTVLCFITVEAQTHDAREHVREVLFGNQPGAEAIEVLGGPYGTGETTGQIAMLSVRNTAAEGIWLQVQPFYIPSNGRNQDYVAPGGDSIYLPPGERKEVPLSGYCGDIRKPPVPSGGQTPLPLPRPSSGLSPEEVVQDLQDFINERPLLFPRLRIAPGHIPFPAYWELLDRVKELVKEAARTTSAEDHPVTHMFLTQQPEEVIQQSFWYVMEGFYGRTYQEEAFRDKMDEQFEVLLGQPVSESSEEVKESVEAGTADLWQLISMTGESAKISTPSTRPTEEYIEENKEPVNCMIDSWLTVDPPYDLDLHVSTRWANVAETATIEANFKDALENYVERLITGLDQEEDDQEFGASNTPLSAHTLWVPEVVGGQVNAYAWTLMARRGQSSRFIWDTEDLEAEASGSRTLEMTVQADEECETHVVIVSTSRIEAHSYAFDPIADHVEVLRPIAFIGNLAVDFVMGIARGGTRAIRSFLLSKAKDAAKEEIEQRFQELENQIRDIAEDYIRDNIGDEVVDGLDIIDWLLNEFQENPQDAVLEMVKEQLIESLSEMLGVDLGEGVDNLEWLLEQLDKMPAEAILDNIPDLDMGKINAASVYALAEGSITHTVGRNTGTARTRSYVTYQRERLEDGSETISGGGRYISEVTVSDHAPGSLTAVCEADGKTGGKASGNGHAKATLGSFTATVAVGICYCPDGSFYDMITTFSYSDKDKYKHLSGQLMQAAEETLEGLFSGEAAPRPGQVELSLRERVERFMEDSR